MATEFKIKNLAALDLKPGEKREVEVDGVEDGKVLLLNVGGKTTAVGARCTHYGEFGAVFTSCFCCSHMNQVPRLSREF